MSDAPKFEDVFKEIREAPRVGPEDLSVWGGAFEVAKLEEFLTSWDFSGEVWTLYRWAHKIEIRRGAAELAKSLRDLEALLERLRVFGDVGDLDLRRDGQRFLWRFVGQAQTPRPARFAPRDYWNERPPASDADSPPSLLQVERKALLWGVREGDRWREDRVARADLRYPGMEEECSVVQAAYSEYLNGGNVELIRLRRLEKGPDRNGGGNA